MLAKFTLKNYYNGRKYKPAYSKWYKHFFFCCGSITKWCFPRNNNKAI